MLASLSSVQDNMYCIACLNRPVPTSRGRGVLTIFSTLNCVCVCVCVCLCIYMIAFSNLWICIDLWAFFFIYFAVGILAIVAKVVQDCRMKSGTAPEPPAVSEQARQLSSPPAPAIQAEPHLVYTVPLTTPYWPGSGPLVR